MVDEVMDLFPWIGDLAAWQAGLLIAAAVGTSIISAIVGMAGGITLLAIMLLFMDPLVAIPLHAIVQLVSNGSRSIIHRKHIQWKILWPYLLPLLPLGWWSLELAQKLPPDIARSLIGIFVLVATWRPGWLLLGTHPGNASPKLRFLGLGTVVGILNVTIGATGPLIAPFFLNLGLTRFELIGSKAACQMGSHIAKIIVFGLVGFAYSQWVGLLTILSVGVIVGTWLGTRILGHVNEVWFVRIYRAVLTVIAIRLALAYAPSWIGF
jgi:uncharacterized membrane protein YfcA